MKKKLISVALLSMIATPAFAADNGIYVGGQLGMASTKFDLPAGSGIAEDSMSPISFGATLGYALNKNFAVEGSYISLGKATYKTVPASPLTIGISSSVLSVAAVGSYPVSNELSVLGRLGFASATSKVSADNCTGCTFPPDAKKSALTYGFGAQYNISDVAGVRLTYDMYTLGESNDPNVNAIMLGKANVFSVAGIYKF